jgi:hypothetical protein
MAQKTFPTALPEIREASQASSGKVEKPLTERDNDKTSLEGESI